MAWIAASVRCSVSWNWRQRRPFSRSEFSRPSGAVGQASASAAADSAAVAAASSDGI
jgi:hypothetical protein